jgi:carbon starvation protein
VALEGVARDLGETTIHSRAGGAPTLAVGIAQIFHAVLPGENTMAFWYHFAILFEALFILTAIDAGTRAGRFMLQDLFGLFAPSLRRTDSWGANMLATAGCVAMWGYLLYQGVVDPLGGINTLWPLFGISNQMLAGIALMLACVVLVKMKRQRYLWVTLLPAAWLLVTTTVAGLLKLFDPDPAVGFIALANKYQAALDAGQILAPARDVGEMRHVIFNAWTNTGHTALFLAVVLSILFYALKVGRAAWATTGRSDRETPFQAAPEASV